MSRADEIGGKVGENLRESLSFLPLSKTLTTIKCDVDMHVGIDDLEDASPDEEALRALFEAFEFKTWMEELGHVPEAGSEREATQGEYELVTTLAALDAWVERIETAGVVAFDTETTDIDYMEARLVGFSFATEPGYAAYVPVGHDYVGAPKQLALEVVLQRLKGVLESSQIKKIGQNLKYDVSVLANHGVEVGGLAFDTMLESYVLNSVAGRHNMDDLAARHLGLETIRYEDIAGKGAKQIAFNEVPVEDAFKYAAEDADVTLRLHHALWPQLEAQSGPKYVYASIELPLVQVLSKVERHGTLVDGGLLQDQGAEIEARLSELQAQAWELGGGEFNLGSTKQLQEVFYERLQLPVLKKTPKGAPSTAEPVLVDLARDYELPRVILEHRGLAKLKSTYTDKLPLQINQRSGRIHTSYHQAVAATGRLSSSDPNLQNIPIRTAEGRRIRQAFVAPQGMSIVAADYSQIELRIMAHLSGDERLAEAFAQDQDIHKATAAEVFGVTPDEVLDDQRRSAKTINFGLIYGMSAFGLGRQLSISRKLAQDYIDRYFARYPGVAAYMDATREQGREQGFVETVFGRRLYLPEINSRQVPRRASGGTHGDQRADAGNRCGHHQAGHARYRGVAERGAGRCSDDHAGA